MQIQLDQDTRDTLEVARQQLEAIVIDHNGVDGLAWGTYWAIAALLHRGVMPANLTLSAHANALRSLSEDLAEALTPGQARKAGHPAIACASCGWVGTAQDAAPSGACPECHYGVLEGVSRSDTCNADGAYAE